MKNARKRNSVTLTGQVRGMRKNFSRLACRVRKKIDPDDLHDLRVLTRRMRAVIWLSRHSRRGPGLGRLRTRLRDLGHALGDRRTLDVIGRDASRYQLDRSSLEKPTGQAGDRVLSQLSSKRRKEFEKLLDNAASRLKNIKTSDLKPAIAELIARLEELKQMHPHRPGEWHRIRIEAKKIRYASELLGLNTDQLKELQDLLGNGHDLEMLMERLGRKARVVSDMKKLWSRAESKAPAILRQAERRLMSWRKS